MKKVLVFGSSGLVGSKFIELFDGVLALEAPKAEAVDILEKDQILKAVEDFNPDSIINFAAYTDVEEAENQKDDKNGIAFKINAVGAKNVAEVCKEADKHLIHISTQYVFDGEKMDVPYNEEDKPNPINWYGQTKYLGEQGVDEVDCKSAVVRISMPYASYFKLKLDIARFFLEQLRLGNKVSAIEDQQISPTLTNNIANALKTILDKESSGIYHVSCTDPTTPLDFVKTTAETFHLDYSLIQSVTLDEYNQSKQAKLLRNSSLNTAKFEREFGEGILHTVEEDLIIFKKEIDEGVKN